MKYDFTSIIDRKGKDAIAVDLIARGGFGAQREGFDAIPMWVADMNFPCFPLIQEAIIERVKHPTFGYFMARDEYFEGLIRWQEKRNGIEGLTKECVGYENGVLGGVASAMSVLAKPGDSVLMHSPSYIGFTHTLTDNGYNIVLSDLVRDEQGVWRMDYEDMEKKIRENKIHVAIFCSPHNPCGRVWEREEIEKAMEVFRRNDVYVISDEIWSDIILTGKHIPTQSVNEDAKDRTIALYAASKTFSLAGLIGSYHIIYNSYLRDRIRSASAKTHYNDLNVLSMYGAIGAFTDEGGVWVDELCQVLKGNADLFCDFFAENYPEVEFAKPQGTYMVYLDFEKYCKARNLSLEDVLKKGWECGVIWQDGRPFHREYAIRVNLASPASRIAEACDRIKKYILV